MLTCQAPWESSIYPEGTRGPSLKSNYINDDDGNNCTDVVTLKSISVYFSSHLSTHSKNKYTLSILYLKLLELEAFWIWDS